MTTIAPPPTPGRRNGSRRRAARRAAEITPWQPGGDFTVGAEEELLLVDAEGRLLGEKAVALVRRLRHGLDEDGAVSGEIFLDQLEFGTIVCPDANAVADSLRHLRGEVQRAGALAMAVGVHPSAPFGEAHTRTSRRYDAIVPEFAGLFRTPTSAFQVHVGMPDPAAAITAYRGLRNRLPLFRALAASSPYWHGIDSGLASARAAIQRSYPRTGVPPLLRSYDEYVAVTESTMAAAEVPDYTYVWWDLRPQPRWGTLEVRVMDAQHSLDRAAGLTALVQGLARHAVEVPATVDLPHEVVVENDFRAGRHGLDARIVDLDGRMKPVRQLVRDAVAQAREVLAGDGLDGPLDVVDAMVTAPLEGDRQRALVERSGMEALVEDLVDRTMREAR
ncbi:hypothetical protein DDE18_16240 [Nocardioides gansuensis]|uniref:Putative glutamate--cysteine ligase 2 n=1 Tax=Nocardioides gansuensis TaxID=2138300 RepID=A0A2T8F787_9ACTN|nr:YbdK family carboxylate-amine ligase [Nocardioides gansuensis]PVG81559.1 hypothetical protein DDE18_16240 [Nocardioides gansuensis]